MNEIIETQRESLTAARIPGVSIRPALPDDLPFIDALQKTHSKQVGFLHRKAIETYIAKGDVLIAEGKAIAAGKPAPLGYVIGRDQYFKHDDVGIIYQLNVVPGSRRKLVGALLVKAMFDNAAYGCKLFCCWCAQDIDANHFWESIGFTALAFRAGSRSKSRVHIFWQKRIRENDVETPWWFPSETSGGAMREDRLVIPIPPGTHWSDAKPLVLPGTSGSGKQSPRLNAGNEESSVVESPVGDQTSAKRRSWTKNDKAPKPVQEHCVSMGGFRFTPPPAQTKPKKTRTRKPKPPKKNNPEYVSAARELRDRFLEQVNSGALLIGASDGGKYDLTRKVMPETSTSLASPVESDRLLDAA